MRARLSAPIAGQLNGVPDQLIHGCDLALSEHTTCVRFLFSDAATIGAPFQDIATYDLSELVILSTASSILSLASATPCLILPSI